MSPRYLSSVTRSLILLEQVDSTCLVYISLDSHPTSTSSTRPEKNPEFRHIRLADELLASFSRGFLLYGVYACDRFIFSREALKSDA